MGYKIVNDDSLTDVADAIRIKGETSGTLEFPDGFISAIQAISGGITPTGTISITQNGTVDVTQYASADVNVSGGGGSDFIAVEFIDYDGTIVHSYTADEFAELTELPANPTHEGLISQGWNWSLADAKDYVDDYGDRVTLIIGQMYITDDGNTRLYCHFEDGRLHPYLGISPDGTVTIDWGDGSNTNVVTGTSTNSTKWVDHEYATPGDYTIVLAPSSGTSYSIGGASTGTALLRRTNTSASSNDRVYSNALQKVELGRSVVLVSYSFCYCQSCKTITIPSGTEITGNNIFDHNIKNKSITLPNNVTGIGFSEFNGCYNIKNISIPMEVTSIGQYAFSSCHKIEKIAIPSGVTSIGQYAFQNCYALSSIVIPDRVKAINNRTFTNCYTITSIELPSGLISIGQYAFYYCYALSSIIIPDGVTSIGSYAFQSCFSLVSVDIPDSVASINSYAFMDCTTLNNIALPNTVKTVSNYVFANCSSLSNLTISDATTSIGNYAFQSCNMLTIEIPDTVTTIGGTAFYQCYAITKFTIPSGVKSIGTQAFAYCTGAKEYHFLPTTPPTITNTNVFSSIPSDCIIYVPQESLEAYQTAQYWSTYASYMQGE